MFVLMGQLAIARIIFAALADTAHRHRSFASPSIGRENCVRVRPNARNCILANIPRVATAPSRPSRNSGRRPERTPWVMTLLWPIKCRLDINEVDQVDVSIQVTVKRGTTPIGR